MPETSWLKIDPDSHFSIDNIPFGIASKPSSAAAPRPAAAVGDYVIFLEDLAHGNALSGLSRFQSHLAVLESDTLNAFAALGRPMHQAFRLYIRDLLLYDTAHPALLKENEPLRSKAIQQRSECRLYLPMRIGDYTDFYAGLNHAYNVGVLFRGPQNALQPNYVHLPVGYHGRASTVRVSGTPIRRPLGQCLPQPGATTPTFGPCKKLDIELEFAAFVCKSNGSDGRPVQIGEAADYIFGFVLMNDWSARDIQAWEYVPLGPFNSKNFGTSISPWIVLADALEPFRQHSAVLTSRNDLLPYLDERAAEGADAKGNHYDIRLTVGLRPANSKEPIEISHTNASQLLFSFPQMLAHHTITGCELGVGDLLGSGTISGPDKTSVGSLLEMTSNGKEALEFTGVSDGAVHQCVFLEDGDEVVLSGVAGEKSGYVGFGECSGVILPAWEDF